MLIRIVFVAILALGLMIAVKSGHILRGAGLLSECQTMMEHVNWGELRACTPGKLDGKRDLSDNCTDLGAYGGKEYWRCPFEAVSPA
jgi:hypothetical protein